MSRLLIVSNRLPVTVHRNHGEFSITKSSGGLATGMKGPHERSDSLWLGWPGDVGRRDDRERASLGKKLAELRTVPVFLTQTQIRRYYEGFANGILWPLFHYLTDRLDSDVWRDWKTYAEVNQLFAETIAEHYEPGDTVWVHDYQLALVPVLLRQLIPEATIGFFLHIPFPSSDVFRILPWRTEILEGMLGADLLGFHTYTYLRHFSRSVNLILGLDVDGDHLHYSDRDVRLGVFPMGIDATEFSRVADSEDIVAEVRKIRSESSGQKLLLGIDRLDYTKGLPRRLLAIDRLLTREPSLRGKVRLVQVVVPSRSKVESYKAYRQELDEMVGRINGAHGTVNAVPVHYLYHSISQEQLVALYKAADVMLVTPLRDGMNLVAKEFVASRTDEDGVLILSEFAGAASELAEALIVNPYDSDGVATAILRAFDMPKEERATRIRGLRRRVQSNDSFHWANAFLETLDDTRKDRGVAPRGVSSAKEIDALVARVLGKRELVLLLDYDGSLVPFASSPLIAAPDPDLMKLLKALAARPGTRVHVVSGRARDIMDQWFGELPVGLHAEHGFWSKPMPGGTWLPLGLESLDWKDIAMPVLERYTTATPGSLIEEKTAAITWHHRMADPEFGARQSMELGRTLGKELESLPVEVLPGNKFLEVRMRGLHKGVIVKGLEAAYGGLPPVLAMGDDLTDEDLFAALPPDGFAVHVGPRPSRAIYRLAGPAAARAFLSRLLDRG